MELVILFIILVVIFLGIVGVIVLYALFHKKKDSPQLPGSANDIPLRQQQPNPPVKRCPQCQSTYTDQSLNFCLSDGATLLSGDEEYETIVRNK